MPCSSGRGNADADQVRPLFISEREFFIDNLLVRIHLIIVMIRWTGLAPWEFEFPFSGSLASAFLFGFMSCFHFDLMWCLSLPLPSEEGTTCFFKGVSPQSPGQNLVLTVLYVPYSLDSGLMGCSNTRPRWLRVGGSIQSFGETPLNPETSRPIPQTKGKFCLGA